MKQDKLIRGSTTILLLSAFALTQIHGRALEQHGTAGIGTTAESTAQTIGEQFIEFANLLSDPDTDPEGYECYAHLAIDPESGT